MILLLLFAFLSGIITVLSPCILPILPIILSSTLGTENLGKSRPLGVVLGFILSFTFFTLFLSTIVSISGIPADTLRLFSVLVIGFFGLSLLIPQAQIILEKLFSKLSLFILSPQNKRGFGGGLIIGLSIGLLWIPCVGPILASVISLAISNTVTLGAFFITLAYSLGTAIPMLIIMYTGQSLLRKNPWLMSNLANIQKIFGIFMILTALGIYLNLDRQFQNFILVTFPNYSEDLTQLEKSEVIKDLLPQITK